MASMELSAGLLEIVNSLTQDDIPFKLRCAVCNKLAVNAFRLPCCDQAICENCQTTLPDSCPVCEHNPVSPDLCKPNKALRTTLKAFLRTEEKKREKDRPSATPAPALAPPVETATSQVADEAAPKKEDEATPVITREPVIADEPVVVPSTEDVQPLEETEPLPQPSDQPGEVPNTAAGNEKAENIEENTTPAASGALVEGESQPTQQDMASANGSNTAFPNMGFGVNPGMMPNGPWAGQDLGAMTQFMPNTPMNNMQNPMGMLGIDPMTVAQGMFGGFGMNMNNMSNGMNVGFGSGQQMYGNWDNSQNNMYNPTAFANGMGQDYRASGYAGYMSQDNGSYSQMQQYSNQNYNQGGYYGNNGPGYMRGMGRGRGRGYYRGRGGYYGQMHANNQYQQGYQNNVSSEAMEQTASAPSAEDVKKFNDDLAPGGEDDLGDGPLKDETAEAQKALGNVDRTGDPDGHKSEDGDPQDLPDKDGAAVLQGIPTIDSLDSASSNHDGYQNGPMLGHMEQGYGRGRGYGRGGFYNNRGGYYQNAPGQQPAIGQGVVGAPVAPRAMRQGLPNISTRRLYPGHGHNPSTGEAPENASRSATPTTTPATMNGNNRPQSPSAKMSRMRSQSPSQVDSGAQSRPPQSPAVPSSRHDRHRRDRSQASHASEANRDKDRRRDDRDKNVDRSRSRSPSQTKETSRRSSHRPDRDRERDTKPSHRSHRSRRHRSRSGSRYRDGESPSLGTTNGSERKDLASRITTAQRLNKESSGRSREDRSSRRDREKRRDRERDYDYERDRDRDRDRDRHREKEKDRPRDRDREREREKDRKRPRRDRSASPNDSDSSHRHSRRVKRSHNRDENDSDKRRPLTSRTHASTKSSGEPPSSSKDPHTLEREARNRERMMKEQQRRTAATTDRDGRSSRGRHDRDRELAGGRRLSYKYEDDEDGMNRIEEEREASRWA